MLTKPRLGQRVIIIEVVVDSLWLITAGTELVFAPRPRMLGVAGAWREALLQAGQFVVEVEVFEVNFSSGGPAPLADGFDTAVGGRFGRLWQYRWLCGCVRRRRFAERRQR